MLAQNQPVAMPVYWKMKRVWIAAAVPLLILFYGGLRTFIESSPLWGILSLMLLLFAFAKYQLRKNNASTVDYFNERTEGLWSHTFADTSMKLDTRAGTIFLKEGKNEKTYSLSDVKAWRYSLLSGGDMVGMGVTGSLIAKSNNDAARGKQMRESGFFVEMNDIHYPEWQIKFFPREGKFHSEKGQRDTEIQLKRWMQIFAQTINHN